MNEDEKIIQHTVDDKDLERDANELRNRYNQCEYIQTGDILIFKRLSEAYLRLIWALRRQRKS